MKVIHLAATSFLFFSFCDMAGAATTFPWQEEHARLNETGNIKFDQRSFYFKIGDNVRYIDYENGADNNPGTRDKPWKHHPWDAKASGESEKGSGVNTYMFKGSMV